MKYLSDIMQDRQTQCFEDNKTFFAFNSQQLEEGKNKYQLDDSVKLVSMGTGMICPKANADKLHQELETIYKDAILEDIKLHTLDRIILRELENHECFYTGDITDCVEKLKDYPNISEEKILKIYKKNFRKYDW